MLQVIFFDRVNTFTGIFSLISMDRLKLESRYSEEKIMKLQRILMLTLALAISLATIASSSSAQTTRTYQQMTASERTAFVREQAQRIARQMSGTDYQFTDAFTTDIQDSVDAYVQRIGNKNAGLGKSDPRLILERGQTFAPTLISIFKARDVSPLIGLYIPWIESAYINVQSPNSMGAIGMFQFLPQTGEHFGLTPQELLDVEKSADAAARYITASINTFKDDPMKEALALLAYNRGAQKTAQDLKVLINDQNKQCSICALTADRGKLDERFRDENVFYVPRFFAAAIIGEDPPAFGLQMQPLSSNQ